MAFQLLQNNKNNFYVLTGNFLEFFDLFMYIHLAQIIHKYYFVGANEGLLTAFTFANLYLIAPIGCIIFAYLGDTMGRKKVIVSTSVLMAFCSSIIGIVPTADSIGAYAGVFLIFLRVLQGVSLSGEPLAAGLYLIESIPLRYAPLFVSLLRATECLGGAIALGIGYTAIHFWGEPAWRVPFYLGIFFCFFSLWLRWNLAESKEYLAYTSDKKTQRTIPPKKSFWEFYSTLNFRHRNFICWIGLGGCTYGTAFSIAYVYLGNFLMRQFGLTNQELLLHNFQVTLCEMAVALLWGLGVVSFDLNVKKFMIYRTLLFLVLLAPIAYVLQHSPSLQTIFIIQVILLSFSERAAICASLCKAFPIMGRYSLMAVGWAVSRLFSFFITGVVLNFLALSYDVSSMIAVMMAMTILFLLSLIFYIPYEEAGDTTWSFEKLPQPAKGI